MIVDPRPYMIVKSLRVCDLRDDDVVWVDVSTKDDDLVEFRWKRWGDVPHYLDDIELVRVQVRESPGVTHYDYGESPAAPTEADPTYRDTLRGATP